MFAKACEKVSGFTHPLVISTKTVDGTVKSSVATYFLINRAGWALTAAHTFISFEKHNQDMAHLKEVEKIREQDRAEGKESKVIVDPNWITNHSFWFGQDGIQVSQIHLFKDLDVAAFKLENLPSSFSDSVAKLNDSDEARLGQSLCLYGYPFIEIRPTFENNNFKLPISADSFKPYVVSGMLSRKLNEIVLDKPIESFEISTPAMKGFSGSPVFDVDGNVLGLQTKTISRYMDFEGHAVVDGSQIKEHQFNNTSIAVSMNVIRSRLAKVNIVVESSFTDSDGCSYILK